MLRLWLVFVFVSTLSGCARPAQKHDTLSADAPLRTYYIAAEDVDWDYAPPGPDGRRKNVITGKPYSAEQKVFVSSGPQRVGSVYRKSLYREYTDASFTVRKPHESHLGILGPTLRAQVGDEIRVVFRNNTSLPQSMHPHGVFYDKASEGAPYNDGTTGADKKDDLVAAGDTYAYSWSVPERAGPGPRDPSSIAWLYHSHVQSVRSTNAGLIGTIVVTRKGMASPQGRPLDVDREFVTLFNIFDENVSTHLEHNIGKLAEGGRLDPSAEAFQESNLMHAINGYVYGHLPGIVMNAGERVRWYLVGMGTELDLHTPHWHANTVLHEGSRTDVIELLPASMKVADMVAESPGVWLYHCHVNDHILAGMQALYAVGPLDPRKYTSANVPHVVRDVLAAERSFQ